MARTKLITAAGAAALLEYVTTGPITGLFELGETDRHETAFRNVAASLAKIARRSQRPPDQVTKRARRFAGGLKSEEAWT